MLAYCYVSHFQFLLVISKIGDRGSTEVKALRYKSEGRWFESRWCQWKFSLT